MENQNNTLWDNLAIIFNDEINIESIISEFFRINYAQLESLEKLTISGNTLITGDYPTSLHLIGTSREQYLSEDSTNNFFHELENPVTAKNLTDLISSNNVTAKYLQIFLKGKTNNNFTVLPIAICKLHNLREVSVNATTLQNIPPEIENLQKLESLNLSNNALRDLPYQVENLSSLKQLYLRRNPFNKLHVNIFKLSNLQYLNIEDTNINELPNDLYKLVNLRSLNLSNTNLKSLPNQVTDISSLKRLDVNHNQLVTLPSTIKKLKNLTHLYASNNNIDSLPSEIGQLEILRYLDLSNNSLTSLPDEIVNLSLLEQFDITHNNLNIPPEIGEKITEPRVILNYYQSISLLSKNIPGELEEIQESLKDPNIRKALKKIREKLGYPINEIKLLIIGQGSVGKTSIVEQILHGKFDQNQRKTEGVAINEWKIKIRRPNLEIVEGKSQQNQRKTEGTSITQGQTENIKCNLWDFGGQEIMHATHQFFLTKRSLYLLVIDSRETQEQNRVEYWLKIIQSLGGESPVLIVGNKIDQHPLDIDRTGLQKKYTNIVGILETSAATGAGIEALKIAIAEQVNNLPHVRDLLPKSWFTVKTKLEGLGRESNFITYDKYLELCAENEVSDEISQHTLIGFLHDLGVVLHFQDDPRLEALGILNPQWVTNGVYKILNSHTLFQNKGVLTTSMLDEILDRPEYPRGKRLFIVDMMKKFELCYDIEPDKTFLIPDLLPKDEPYTGEWNGALAFQIHYNILPSSIISRFIVRMNTFVHKTVWRAGVVLKKGDNTALIKADTEDKKIYIWVNGNQATRRDFLAVIRTEFEAIHKTIAKIEAVEKVPLPENPEATPVDLAFLQRLASEGRESLPVQVGNRIIDLIVKEVLSQIEKEGKPSAPNIVVNVQGDMYGAIGNSNTVNFIQKEFEPIYKAIEVSSRTEIEKQDLVEEVNEIKSEVTKGEQISESFLARRLRNLKKMAPDIAEVAFACLTGPGTAVAAIVKNVAKKIKEETK